MTAQIRSVMIYKYTPLIAAKFLKIEDIEKMELQLKRIAFRTSRDIPNVILRNVTELKETNTSEIIRELVLKNMKKINLKIDNFIKPKKVNEEIKKQENESKKRNKIFITKNVIDTMMAISQGRTLANYGMQHYCIVHKVCVDANHMKACNLINSAGDQNRFSKQIKEKRIVDMNKPEQIEIIANMVWLDDRIRKLETHQYYQPIRKTFRISYVKKKNQDFNELNLNTSKEIEHLSERNRRVQQYKWERYNQNNKLKLLEKSSNQRRRPMNRTNFSKRNNEEEIKYERRERFENRGHYNKKRDFWNKVQEVRFNHRDRSKDQEAMGMRNEEHYQVPLNKQMGFKSRLKIGKTNPSKRINETQAQRVSFDKHADGSECIQKDQMKFKSLIDLSEVQCRGFDKIIYAKKGWTPMVTRMITTVCCPSSRTKIEKALVQRFDDRERARRKGVNHKELWSEKQHNHWRETNAEWKHFDLIPGNHIQEETMEAFSRQIEEVQFSQSRQEYIYHQQS
ncbi:hypothetical protein OXYTRIMIC_060 [Oxytricha trifallax]|uniref:Uncharacterized protein n=1 Tax=Oxytricha trifallax TaxID=1172189 RepID=A0A073HZ31_9SPIT|nr:hypothetical protein OXYTRIMIC_060 [Oxytricha trifallax]